MYIIYIDLITLKLCKILYILVKKPDILLTEAIAIFLLCHVNKIQLTFSKLCNNMKMYRNLGRCN